MGIAYTQTSRYAEEINASNWYQILARPDIKLGIPDARLDACGYWALMLLSLAESFYYDNSIFHGVLGIFNPSLGVSVNDGVTVIAVPKYCVPRVVKSCCAAPAS